MPSTDRLSNIARARVSAVVLDEASGRERAATEVFNKVDADGEMGCHSNQPPPLTSLTSPSHAGRHAGLSSTTACEGVRVNYLGGE